VLGHKKSEQEVYLRLELSFFCWVIGKKGTLMFTNCDVRKKIK
jgi:hypothetical protein